MSGYRHDHDLIAAVVRRREARVTGTDKGVEINWVEIDFVEGLDATSLNCLESRKNSPNRRRAGGKAHRQPLHLSAGLRSPTGRSSLRRPQPAARHVAESPLTPAGTALQRPTEETQLGLSLWTLEAA
jgi:hypothetical protein